MRSRSRSRSWERGRRSRSRERGGRSRPRKLSPMTRRRERRSSWSKSPVRNRSRSRSPAPRHRRYRSSSRTPPHDGKKGTPNSGGATPTQDSNHGDVDMRLTTTSQSIQSVVSAPEHSTVAAVASNLAAAYKRRCRDFDEKGYCMRGDLCPYDHGSDPVVLEDMTLGPLAFSNTTAPPPPLVPVIPGAVVPSRPPPLVTGLHHQEQGPRMPVRHLRSGTEYSPDAPGMGRGWFRPGFRGQPDS
ncbi:hypothetical protein B566_EDAN012674 [Ephemera danica]|nr:hypothetical protein B566_EDAN012674 [Ephemera danica]